MTTTTPAATTQTLPQDALNREPYLANLNKLITRLDKGVIAIDGEWGSGKSWFGQKLKEKLHQQAGFKTIWLDVFEADWSDDPAVSLIAAIAQQLEPAKAESFLDKAAPVLAAVLPLATKTAAKAVLNYVGVDKELTDGLAQIGEKQAEKYFKKHLQQATEKGKNLKQLKELLNQTVQETKSKLIIFVDELDRCSPAFAVRMLERLKHLFDLEGVVYVLLWNRTQVARTVEAFYGSGSDGQMFLDKFIDVPLHLPISQAHHNQPAPLHEFIKSITSHNLQYFETETSVLLAEIAFILSMTAREVQRYVFLWVMSLNRPYPYLDAWLLGVKVKHPNLFSEIRKFDRFAHKQAHDLLMSKTLEIDKTRDPQMYELLCQLHQSLSGDGLSINTKSFVPHFYDPHTTTVDGVKASLRRLEFDFT